MELKEIGELPFLCKISSWFSILVTVRDHILSREGILKPTLQGGSRESSSLDSSSSSSWTSRTSS